MSRTEPQQGHHRETPLTQHPSPSRNEDGFIADEIERAKHWLKVFETYWTAKRGWQ